MCRHLAYVGRRSDPARPSLRAVSTAFSSSRGTRGCSATALSTLTASASAGGRANHAGPCDIAVTLHSGPTPRSPRSRPPPVRMLFSPPSVRPPTVRPRGWSLLLRSATANGSSATTAASNGGQQMSTLCCRTYRLRRCSRSSPAPTQPCSGCSPNGGLRRDRAPCKPWPALLLMRRSVRRVATTCCCTMVGRSQPRAAGDTLFIRQDAAGVTVASEPSGDDASLARGARRQCRCRHPTLRSISSN